MRALVLAGLASLALAAQAQASPVAAPPAAFSADFQTTLVDDYGEREGAYLQDMVSRALARELARVGGSMGAGGVTIETTIIDARPNRPTFQQLADTPGLDAIRSISTGGAELVAVLRGPDGAQLGEVRHRYYETSLQNVLGETTWGDARRSIRMFARKVAREYQRVAR